MSQIFYQISQKFSCVLCTQGHRFLKISPTLSSELEPGSHTVTQHTRKHTMMVEMRSLIDHQRGAQDSGAARRHGRWCSLQSTHPPSVRLSFPLSYMPTPWPSIPLRRLPPRIPRTLRESHSDGLYAMLLRLRVFLAEESWHFHLGRVPRAERAYSL